MTLATASKRHLSYGEVPASRVVQLFFLATNLPFFACALALAARGYAVLGVATAAMGFVSGGFHWYQCQDGQGSERVRLWLIGDFAMCAVLVVLNVATATGWPSLATWGLGIAGLSLLYVGTIREVPGDQSWRERFYTVTHGLWHCVICAASTLFVVQSHDVPESGGAGTEVALSLAAVVSAAGTGLFVLRGCPCGRCPRPSEHVGVAGGSTLAGDATRLADDRLLGYESFGESRRPPGTTLRSESLRA